MEMFGDLDLGDEETSFRNSKEREKKVCEVKDVHGIGGGRGVFASQSLPAGTLVCGEVPIVTWPQLEIDTGSGDAVIDLTKLVLQQKKYYKATLTLHPQCLADADDEEVATARTTLDGKVDLMVQDTKEAIDEDELVRVFLCLQHNGFESGLFNLLTMFNHSCSPNCIKFPPLHGTAGYSEIWTIKNVDCGDELTISYSPSSLITRKSMQNFLESHHRFRCCCQHCENDGESMEREIKEPPLPSHIDVEAIQRTLETIESELRCLFVENSTDSYLISLSMMKTVQKLIDLLDEGKMETKSEHMLKIQCYKTSINCAVKVLQSAEALAPSFSGTGAGTKKPKTKILVLSATTYLRNSFHLLTHQLFSLGAEHPDLATTYEDISQGMCCMLRFSHEDLVRAFTPSIFPWAATKKQCREESLLYAKKSRQIQSLYKSTIQFPVHKRPRDPGSIYIATR
jgi:hypothetical protein